MSHILTLEVPEDVYTSVQQLALEAGEDVNDFCLRHLQADIEKEKRRKAITEDPFWKAAGSLESGVPELAERHDSYLADSIADNHENA
ncbi:hypothetical protein EON80_09335 [bacterium]|nr:MAG: hypothetical protein EON80_09335 [bacterium]